MIIFFISETIQQFSLEIVLWVIYSAQVGVHNEDSLESKMEFKFVQRRGAAVISREQSSVS